MRKKTSKEGIKDFSMNKLSNVMLFENRNSERRNSKQ